jgi:hypothetical protein
MGQGLGLDLGEPLEFKSLLVAKLLLLLGHDVLSGQLPRPGVAGRWLSLALVLHHLGHEFVLVMNLLFGHIGVSE